ncbi:MAG: acyl carrier protein [Bacilli bacterium]|jgi:acyl carrier protein|nr:acyl carrier protein [Bacilli bacterium]
MEEKVINIISSVCEIDKKDIKLDSNLINDLELESLDVVDLVVAFEKEFNIKIDDKDIKQFQTVEDIVKYLEK